MRETIATCYPLVNSILLVPDSSILLSNGKMQNKEIRRANLLLLLKDFRSVAELARRTDVDETYMRNIKNGVRDMGDDIAERIEKKLGKPSGSPDQ